MNSRRRFIMLVLLLLAGLTVFALRTSTSDKVEENATERKGDEPGCEEQFSSAAGEAGTKQMVHVTPSDDATADQQARMKQHFARLMEALQHAQERAKNEQRRREAVDVRTREGTRGENRWTVTKEGIQGAIHTAMVDIHECYDAWLLLNPTMGGKVIVKFRIEVDERDASVGRAVKAALAGEGLGNQFMDGCILASLSSLELEAPTHPGGIDVTYPFTFASSKVEGP